MATVECGSSGLESHPVSSPEVSRLVTALLVLEAVRLGELGLDESIACVLPALGAWSQPLTVRDLLRGETGLRDIRDVLEARGLGEEGTASASDALALVARQRVLRRVPSTWDNDVASREAPTEDLLLALAVQARAGAPFPAVAEARLFAPLGMDGTSVVMVARASEPSGPVRFGALLGFRGVVTTAPDLARLGVGLVANDSLAPALGEALLGANPDEPAATATRLHGTRWCARDARAALGRPWRVFGSDRVALPVDLRPRWSHEPETARLAVLASEGWAIAAVCRPGDAPDGALAAVVAASIRTLEPWLRPRSESRDWIGIGRGAGGRLSGRTADASNLDDTRLLGLHQVPELGLDLTVEQVATGAQRSYQIRLGTHAPVVGVLTWRNEELVITTSSNSHRLTLHVALEGERARLQALDLERGFTTYGPLLALIVDADDAAR